MRRPLHSSKHAINLLLAASGITSDDLHTADRVLKEFFHVGTVYHKLSRRFIVSLAGYGLSAHVGLGATLGQALKMALKAAEAANGL